MLIVLNDNEMSISPTVGGLSTYLSQIKLSGTWQTSKRKYDSLVGQIPGIGPTLRELSQRFRHSVVNFAQAGRLFEDLGITYIGLVPGHDIRALLSTFSQALELPGPVIVHVRTQKGHGFQPAETDQVGFHGAALPPMSVPATTNGNGRTEPVAAATASSAPMPTESMTDDAAPPTVDKPKAKHPNYTAVFVAELIELARTDRRIVGITAGMPTGTGLSKFQAEFPERFIDVGIAEQHSVALATGLAMGGMRPVVALYSTFLQRAFDQTVHDVCQNDQPVLLAVDRAGLVGEDGTSHQGMFTLPAQRQLPNLVIASPKDEQELRSLVRTALGQDLPSPSTIRATPGFGLPAVEPEVLPVGRGELIREGSDVLFVGFGPIVDRAREAADAARRRRLVGRRHQRPVRQAARPRPDPRPGPRQAARGDIRGERRQRRVRIRRAGGDRGGATRRRDASGHRRPPRSGSPATSSSTTAPLPTFGRCSGSTRPGSRTRSARRWRSSASCRRRRLQRRPPSRSRPDAAPRGDPR